MALEKQTNAKKPQTVETPAYTHKSQGNVPKYLDKFKKEREEVKRRKEIEAENAKLPPGTRLMPEDERLNTLADLKASGRSSMRSAINSTCG